MGVARRVHLRGHGDTPIARRQLGLISDVTAALLGLGNTKTNNPNHSTGGSNGNTPAAPVPGPTTTPANGDPTPTATPGGGGGDNGGRGGGGVSDGGGGTTTSAGPSNMGGSVTSTGTQTRTSGTPSELSPAPSRGSTGSGPDFNPTVNVKNISSGPGNGGLSDLTPGTGTSGGPTGSSPSTNVNTLSDGKSNTPGGAIAAAVICILLFTIAIVVFILRKRSRNRRDEHALQWWFTRNRTSQSYGDNEALNRGSSSRRSSFATTRDYSFLANLNEAIPPPPPMAEVGRSNGTDPALVLDIHRRFSIGSATSLDSQFLIVHHRESLQHENSASLQSCTESFPFPKPPPGDHTLLYSNGRIGSPKKQESELLYVRPIPPLSDPFADNNPFDDSPSLPAPLSGTSSEVETVRSLFIPKLHDELLVNIGDSVRVVRTFDDGWAFVEKMSWHGIPTGEHGLIPLNCFRLNSSPGGKRMSSQGANNA